jgi:pyruvate/2-oxoglutarate dehydrogenase complex dihydrolipoamide acyltransferase (E2) component
MWTAAAHSLILPSCRVPVAAEEAREEQEEGGKQQREQPPAKRQQHDGGKSPSKPAVAATAGESHTTTNTDGSNGSGAGKQMAVSDHQVPSSAKPAAEAAAAPAVNPEAAKRGELLLFCWLLGVGRTAGLYTGHPWGGVSHRPVCSFVAAGTRYVSNTGTVACRLLLDSCYLHAFPWASQLTSSPCFCLCLCLCLCRGGHQCNHAGVF